MSVAFRRESDDEHMEPKFELPIPPGWYSSFARWHMLSLMRAPKTLRDIAEVARTADRPERPARRPGSVHGALHGPGARAGAGRGPWASGQPG